MIAENKQKLTVGVQHSGDVKVFLGHIEGRVQVLQRIILGEFAVVDQVGPVPVDEGTERQTVLEGQVEVLNIDVLVWSGLTLAPEKQTFL